LGWRPQVFLEEGVARTVRWHRQRSRKAPTG
jgi:nucleoside-diphosphate-sugar epimerase